MTSYTESVLNTGENINFVARYHWIYMFLSICWLTLGSLILIGPFVLPSLNSGVQAAVLRFFAENETWLLFS